MQTSANHFDQFVPDWNHIEQATMLSPATVSNEGVVALETSAGVLAITFHADYVRVKNADNTDNGYAIVKSVQDVIPCCLVMKESHCVLKAGQWKMTIQHQPFSFTLFYDEELVTRSPTDGHFVRQNRIPPLSKTAQGWLFSFDLSAQEPIYGLGEKWGRLDKRGQFIRSYNHDALGVNAEISYKNTPFAWSPSGWGVFTHTPAPVSHAVGFAQWSHRTYSVLIEDQDCDLFIMRGKNGAQMLDIYTDITGKAPTPPVWSLGIILSKAYYKDVPELLQTAADVREQNMPCDVITLDGRAWQDTDTRFAFEWDPKRFDDPADVINQLKAQNFKVCVWEYPLVSVLNPLFNEMAEKGWLLKHKLTGETYRYQWDQSAFGEVLTPLPESGIVDFTHPDAFAFWREAHKPLFDLGVDMIKADFGEQVEDDNMLAYNGDSGQRLHNVYSLLYNRCVYEAAHKYCRSGPFLFSRSAWSGSQCYPSQWGGDPQADWGGLAGSLRGALSWGMSGAPFYATDVGGFYKDTRDAELFVRWVQAALFSAHMRLHGIGQREPWSYGEQAQAAANTILSLRYQLLPYIQQTVETSSKTGLPVMRAMPLAFPDERPLWAFELQFMFGPDILVVPCVQAGGEVEYMLPQGDWLRFPSGEPQQGGKAYKHNLALDELAVFVRNGATIPIGPALQHTASLDGTTDIIGHWPQQPLDLR